MKVKSGRRSNGLDFQHVSGGGRRIPALTGVAEALAKILDLREQEGQEGERKGEDSDGSEETMTRLWVKT